MKNIPNLITLLRILITPFIPISYFHSASNRYTIFLVTLAALSDFLDGFLARRFDLVTPLGKVLDPLADKLFLLSVIFTLYFSNRFHLIFLLLYLIIDVGMIITGLILYSKKERALIPSNLWGKSATALFFASAFYTLFVRFDGLAILLFGITITLKALALMSYIHQYYAMKSQGS